MILAIVIAAAGLARVQAQGELRWAGDLQGGEPFVFRDPRDPAKLVGFEVEIARGLAARLHVSDRFVQSTAKRIVAREDGRIEFPEVRMKISHDVLQDQPVVDHRRYGRKTCRKETPFSLQPTKHRLE